MGRVGFVGSIGLESVVRVRGVGAGVGIVY